MANVLMAIAPYWRNEVGTWVYDDLAKGRAAEPFVAGTPEIIDRMLQHAGLPPREQFTATFSASPFPGYQFELEWVREDYDGNVYRWDGHEGWLCPALFDYFERPPKRIYIQVRQPDSSANHPAPRDAPDSSNPLLPLEMRWTGTNWVFDYRDKGLTAVPFVDGPYVDALIASADLPAEQPCWLFIGNIPGVGFQANLELVRKEGGHYRYRHKFGLDGLPAELELSHALLSNFAQVPQELWIKVREPDYQGSCGICGADLGPSRYVWHYPHEDCHQRRGFQYPPGDTWAQNVWDIGEKKRMAGCCTLCGAHLGPSTTERWHHAEEDCQDRDPIPGDLG